jgi:hypothetical protein
MILWMCWKRGKQSMSDHPLYKFSATIRTDDLSVVGCLRALSKFSQKFGNNNIPWGGTKDADWKRDKHHVTFRFSTPQYRDGFLAELNRLLPSTLWAVTAKSDNDPARPQ